MIVELGKVKERIHKFALAGAPEKEQAYIDAEAKIEDLTARMQKPLLVGGPPTKRKSWHGRTVWS